LGDAHPFSERKGTELESLITRERIQTTAGPFKKIEKREKSSSVVKGHCVGKKNRLTSSKKGEKVKAVL